MNAIVIALVSLVIGVEYAERLGPRGHAEVDIRKVTNIYARPVVLPFPDDANQPVCGVFQQVPDNAAGSAVDNSRSYDDGSQRAV